MADVIVSQLYISECCSAAALKEHSQIPYESRKDHMEHNTTHRTALQEV